MDWYAAAAIIVTLTALFSYVNRRFVGLPTVIGVMLGALVGSLLVIVAGATAAPVREEMLVLLGSLDFDDLLMQGMLSFLLFAGALHVDLEALRRQAPVIAFLALLGVVLSTFLIGLAIYGLLAAIGYPIPFLWALVFGSLISPTDPIAVLGLLRQAKAPEKVETLIVGESLFNDGVGVVVFGVLATLLGAGGHGSGTSPGSHGAEGDFGAAEIATLFATEAFGGVLLGLGLGLLAYSMLRAIDDYGVEVLITLAVVMGGYALAGQLHTSGPLAMVVAGLFLGNRGRAFAMSERTRENLDTFWELVDEILNAVLFVLIGMEVLVLSFEMRHALAAAIALPVVLVARLIAVGPPVVLLRSRLGYPRYTVTLLTWGGLRGGISIALALSLPPGDERGVVLFMTYVVVAFSILVQGLTVGRVARRAAESASESAAGNG